MAKKRGKARFDASYDDYREALARTAKALPQVIAVEGPEEHLRARAVETLLGALRHERPALDEAFFHGGGAGEGANLSAVLDELNGASLFASEKVVVLRRADALLFGRAEGETGSGTRSRQTPQQRLEAWIAAPPAGTWLLIELEKTNRQYRLGKALAAGASVPCPELKRSQEIERWLRHAADAHGKTVGQGVADALHLAHGNRLGVLDAELQKLITYVGERPAIERDDVEAFLAGSVEFSIFGLTNAVERRDRAEALTFAALINGQGTRDTAGKRRDADSSSHMALHILATTMENILRARAVLAERLDEREAAQRLGVSPWRARQLLQAARVHDLASLRGALNALCRLLHATHDTGGDPRLALERAVLACCGDRGAARVRSPRT